MKTVTPRRKDAKADGEQRHAPNLQSPISSLQSHANWLLPLILILPILWAYIPGGLPLTADSRVHFVRSAEMVHAWSDGILLPRWSANLGVGLGIPLFNYAPPLPYLTTAALHSLGLPLEAAFKSMHVIVLLIFAFGAYRLVREPLGQWAGLVGAAAILYAPIVLRELFIQGNIGQLLAWAFVPWTLWGVQRVFARPHWRSGLGLALAFAGATLSHNAVTLLLAEIVAAQVLWLTLWRRSGRAFLVAALALTTSLLLTAWFWAPALLEDGYIQVDKIAASSYTERFLTLGELVALSPRLDLRALNPYYPLTLGAVQVILALSGIAALIVIGILTQRRKGAKTKATSAQLSIDNSQLTVVSPWPALRPVLAGFYVLLACFGVLMALPASLPLWQIMPFMDLLEFPFRWHGFTIVALAWLGGFAIYAAGVWRPWLAAAASAVATALLLLAAVVNLYPDKQPDNLWQWDPGAVVAYEVKTGAIGTTSLAEFNPVWAEAPLLQTSPYIGDYPETGAPDRLPPVLPDGVTAQQVAASTQRLDLIVAAANPATMTLNLLYFPGWSASSGTLAPETVTGLMQLSVAAGADQTITLTYTGTPLERTASGLSLLAWLGLAIAAVVLLVRCRPPLADAADRPAPTHGAAPLLAAVAIVAAVLLVRGLAPGWFRYSSPPGSVLSAQTPLHAVFADTLQVSGVDLPPAQVAPGQTLQSTVYLEAQQPPPQDFGLFLHLDRPDGSTVAAVDVHHPDEIPMHTWPAGFYVRAPLKLRVPVDALPIRYALNLGVPDPSTGQWLPLANGETLLRLGYVWVEPPAGAPAGAPLAHFGDSIALLGAEVDGDGTLRLRWRTDTAAPENLTIFVHYLDGAGQLLGQADGAPYDNLYPPDAWRPGQVVEDVRSLPAGIDAADVAAVSVGVYDLTSGVRLPAWAADRAALADGAYGIRP